MMNAERKLNLALLQERFAAGLERRLGEFTALLELLSRTPGDRALLDHTMRAFHSLAGIGGTYGHSNVSMLARAAERLCDTALDAGRGLAEGEIALLENTVSAISLLQREVAASIAGPRAAPRAFEAPATTA